MPDTVILDIKPKENKLKPYLPWLAIFVLIAAGFFAVGYGLGKYTDIGSSLVSDNTATKSTIKEGWLRLESESYSIEFPKDWKIEKNPSGEPEGAKITNEAGIVEFWLKIVRSYRFSKEQEKKQTGQKTSQIAVDDREAKVTEFSYEYGGFFMAVDVPAKEKLERVTFWTAGANEATKKTVLDIINSFKSKQKK